MTDNCFFPIFGANFSLAKRLKAKKDESIDI